MDALNHPFFVGRIAGVELDVAVRPTVRGRQELERNAGIYAPTSASLAAYVEALLAAYDRCTLIAEWDRDSPVYAATGRGQDLVAVRTPQIPKCSALDLEPYYDRVQWMPMLRGMRVLIVHPFVVSMERQSHRLAEIFPGREWFEGCTFQFVAPPMTLAGNHQGRDWSVHLANLVLPDPSTYDVALVAAGGYGMLIADRIFRAGRSVIYVGGALQLFFGVVGKRWMAQEAIRRLVTDAWVRPSKEEQPRGPREVEGGCYW